MSDERTERDWNALYRVLQEQIDHAYAELATAEARATAAEEQAKYWREDGDGLNLMLATAVRERDALSDLLNEALAENVRLTGEIAQVREAPRYWATMSESPSGRREQFVRVADIDKALATGPR